MGIPVEKWLELRQKVLFKRKNRSADVKQHFDKVFKDVKPAKVGDPAPKFLFPEDGTYETRGGLGDKVLAETTVKDGIITKLEKFV